MGRRMDERGKKLDGSGKVNVNLRIKKKHTHTEILNRRKSVRKAIT